MKPVLPLLLALCVTACTQTRAPDALPPLGQADFASYQAQTRQWLQQHRQFVTATPQDELAYNSPQQWRPAGAPRGAILLVHGLGDSPYSFTDLGPGLAAAGYLVRSVLLPGHGSKPADLMAARYEDWQALVAQQTALLRREGVPVYLGGFSTGANLVMLQAQADRNIAGVLLFSPAFKSDSSIDWLAPWVAPLKPWLRQPDEGTQQTPVRYLNVPTHGFGLFYRSSSAVLSALAAKPYDKPAFMVLAEHDSVVDVGQARTLFQQRFTHPASRLVWYGRQAPASSDTRQLWQSDYLPQQRISQFSHMSVLFSPANPLYGQDGSLRMCRNGQEDAEVTACQRGATVWYSDWGYREPGKVHARLTFNPYFDWQLGVARSVLQAAQPPTQTTLAASSSSH
ncbi:alpha/beta hydrolase [Vogesella mureinivorans]|uniref:alpha/beta hydrolase n=1 Tax=Vogesella mureinivorans TaxID=657276 RepID=UPI0014790A9F|nr:alpha/beta fold hydrolase [Vogesella mureinivorans]